MAKADPVDCPRQGTGGAVGDIGTVAVRVPDKRISAGTLVTGIDIHRSNAVGNHLQANARTE